MSFIDKFLDNIVCTLYGKINVYNLKVSVKSAAHSSHKPSTVLQFQIFHSVYALNWCFWNLVVL